MKKTTKPAAPKTIEEYKKALGAAKRDITMLRRNLSVARHDVAFLETMLKKQSERINELENRSWIKRLFSLKG